jgi:glycosyltransferase involved in cell wall biosynthesis
MRTATLIMFALACGSPIGPVQSAVRDCADFVDNSGGGTTEKEAKAAALAGWMKKVEALGMAQVRWQMAADRSLQCQISGASHYCTAHGRPCVVKQVAPDDWRPQYPKDRRP